MLIPKSQQGGYSVAISKAKRQRELADALRRQSQQELSGSVTPHIQGTAEFGPLPQQYVAPHWTQQVARGMQALEARRMGEEADTIEQEASRQAQEQAQQAMTNFPQMMKTRTVSETVPGEQVPVEAPVIEQQATSPFGTTTAGPVMPGTMLPQARAQFQAGPEQTVTREEQYQVPLEEYATDLAKFTAGLPMDNPYVEPIRQHALKQTLDMPVRAMERQEKAAERQEELRMRHEAAAEAARIRAEERMAAAKTAEERHAADLAFRRETQQMNEQFRRDNMALQADLRRQGYDIQRELRAGRQEGAASAGEAHKWSAEDRMANAFSTQTKDVNDEITATTKLRQIGPTMSGRRPNAMEQQSMIVLFNKFLDPGSVVREGEFDRTAKAQGLYDKASNLRDRILSGEPMSDKLIRDMEAVAKVYEDAAYAKIDAIGDEYAGKATSRGLDPAAVVVSPYYKKRGRGGAASAGKPPQGIKQSEWDAMTPEERKLFQ